MRQAAAIAGLATGISLSCFLLAIGCPAAAEGSALPAGGTPGISISPLWTTTMPGEPCTLRVKVDDAVDSISCSEFTLSFDSGVAGCTDASEGGLYVSSQFPTFFDWYMTGTDTVTVTDCPLGYRSFVLAPGDLFLLVFEGNAEGQTDVRIERGWIYDLDRERLDPVFGQEAHIVVTYSTGDDTPPAGGMSMTCRPNPFNPSTTIRIADGGGSSGSGAGYLDLRIYDPAGRLIAPLYKGPLLNGTGDFEWNGTSASGRDVGSGVYFAVARIGGESMTRKIVLIR